MSSGIDGLHLPLGTRLLNGQFTIIEVLGQGGFGITYRVTQHGVPFARAVKECFPADLAERRAGMIVPRTPDSADLLALCIRTFEDEVRHLSRIRHPSIVEVMQVFPENGTIYMVLDFIEGPTLEAHIVNRGGTLSPAEVAANLPPILDALDVLHRQDLLHRDIAPDNILICGDGTPVLIDFGAARQVVQDGTRHSTGLRAVKDSYSPHEFYVRGTRQGPQSDLYSLAATLYRAITGSPPPSAELRAHALASGELDPYLPLSGRTTGFHPALPGLIDIALSHRFAARPADVAAWRAQLGSGKPLPPPPPPPPPRRWSGRRLILASLPLLLFLAAATSPPARQALAWLTEEVERLFALIEGKDLPARDPTPPTVVLPKLPEAVLPAEPGTASPPNFPPIVPSSRPVDRSAELTQRIETLLSTASLPDLKSALASDPDIPGAALIKREIDWIEAQPKPLYCTITLFSDRSIDILRERIAVWRGNNPQVGTMRIYQNTSGIFLASLGQVEIAAAPSILAGLRRMIAMPADSYCESTTSLVELPLSYAAGANWRGFDPDRDVCHLQVASMRTRQEVKVFLAGLPETRAMRVFVAADRLGGPVFAITLGHVDRIGFALFPEAIANVWTDIEQHQPFCAELMRGDVPSYLRETEWRSFVPEAVGGRMALSAEATLSEKSGVMIQPSVSVVAGIPLLPIGPPQGGLQQVLTPNGYLGWLPLTSLRSYASVAP